MGKLRAKSLDHSAISAEKGKTYKGEKCHILYWGCLENKTNRSA